MNYTFQDLFAYTISNFSNSNDNLAKMFLDITEYLSFKIPKSKYTILESDNNTQIIATFTNSEFDASHMCAVPYHCVVSAKTLITTLKFYNSSTKTLIEISIDNYDAVSYNPSTKSYYPFKNKNSKKTVNLVIFDNFYIFRNTANNKLIPCDLKFISRLIHHYSYTNTEYSDIIYFILDYFGNSHALFTSIKKDLENGVIPLPITLNEIWDFNNKQALIQHHCKNTPVPSVVNIYHLHFGYLLIKCKRYVSQDDWEKLFILNDDFTHYLSFENPFGSIYDQIQLLFKIYYTYLFQTNNIFYDTSIISDYIHLVWNSKLQKIFKLDIESCEDLIMEQNSIITQVSPRKNSCILIPKNSRFNDINLPNTYERITSKRRLSLEINLNKYSLDTKEKLLKKDKCALYSTFYNNRRYTFVIKMRNKKFYLAEIFNKYDFHVPNELMSNIKSFLS